MVATLNPGDIMIQFKRSSPSAPLSLPDTTLFSLLPLSSLFTTTRGNSFRNNFLNLSQANNKFSNLEITKPVNYYSKTRMITAFLRDTSFVEDVGDHHKDLDPAARKSSSLSDILCECSKIMLGGRAVIRRGRQRRVLSKHITRSISQNNIERQVGNVRVPRYIYFILFCFGFCFLSSSLVFTISLIYFIAKKIILPKANAWLARYRERAQRNGPSIGERWYYYLDYWISTNPYSKALVLLMLTLGLILSSGTIISMMADEPWIESLWAAALGSGLDWGFVNSYNPTLRFVAVCTNVGGLVLTALLLSLISDAVQTKYDSLRKGESVVTESRHTLLIGWSVKALSVMTQIAKSGASVGNHNVIVCLTDQREKEDMENDIANYDFSFSNAQTRVVCRSGSPLMYQELRKVSFSRAKSIIILGDDENDAETNDARSLQILLSIVAALEREKADFLAKAANMSEQELEYYRGTTSVELAPARPDRIVIEVMDTENAGIMKSVCPGLVEPVLAHDVVGRLLLQAARNPLVADVWQELLGFDGCEIYSAQWGILRGLSFGEVLLCFEDAIPLGVKTRTGGLHLNPNDSYIIGEGDEIVVLAEDEESYCASISHPLIRERVPDNTNLSGFRFVDICPGGMRAISNFSINWVKQSVEASRLSSRDMYGLDVERILFCGWRFDMGNLLQVFSAVAPIGSEFWILCELDVEQRESELRLRGWEHNNRVKVVHRVGSCRRNVLAQLPLESFTSVIVGGAEASGQAKWFAPKLNGESMVPGGKPEAGGPDARVITVVMMIQDIISRRNIDGKEFASRSASSSVVPDEFDDEPTSGRRIFSSARISKASSSHSAHSNSRGSNSLALDCGKGNDMYSSSSIVGDDVDAAIERSKSANGEDVSRKRSAPQVGLARARSQKFLGAKNVTECTAPRGVIVGEIVDSRSRAMLSMVNSIDAVVASSELISKAVAMVSEDSSVNRVLNTLFDPYDSEITLEGVERYIEVNANERVSFFEMMARGRRLGTIVLGYLEREIVPHSEPDNNSTTIRYVDVALNPENKDVRRGWHVDDLLIVLTPGASEAGSGAPSEPSEFLADVEQVKTLDITREFSWDYDSNGTATKARVRFSGHE